MFISQFNPDRSTRAVLSDPERLHRAVWRFFHFDRDAARGFLFRREGEVVVVLSQVPPLPRLPGWTSRISRYEPRFREGESFLFRVRINPTVAQDGKRCDRIQRRLHQEPSAHLSQVVAEEGRAWLERREQALGFRCLEPGPLAGDYRQLRFRKFRDGQPVGRPVVLGTLELNGAAVVTDPVRFQQTLTFGIGHAKGYGCGLMLTQTLEEAVS